MKGDVEGEFVSGRKLVPAQQPPHNDEMPGARNRDELRQALNNGQNNRLIDGQILVRRISVGWNALLNVKDQALGAQGPVALSVLAGDFLP